MANERPLTQQEIQRMLHDKDRCMKDIEYANAIKMDAQVIEGTRYKFRFSETHPER